MAGLLLVAAAIWLSLAPDPALAAQDAATASRSASPEQFRRELEGPILSIPTPFTRDGAVDYDGVREMIRRARAHGIRIFNLTGGNSRYDMLAYDEIRELTRVMQEAAGADALTIGCAHEFWTARLLDYARYARSLGVDAIQVTAPSYLGAEELPEYFRTLGREEVDLAIVLGNQDLPGAVMEQLLEIPQLVAMKEDSTLTAYIDNLRRYGDRLNIYSGGSLARFLVGRPYGARAYFCSYTTFAPQISARFWEAVRAGDEAEAFRLAERYDLPWIDRFSHPWWRATLEYFGVAERWLRPPMRSFTDEELRQVETFFQNLGLHPDGEQPRRASGEPAPANPASAEDMMDWSWNVLSPLPHGVGAAHLLHDEHGVYLVGGDAWTTSSGTERKVNLDTIYRLRLSSGRPEEARWGEAGRLPVPIANGAIGLWRGRLFLMGGKSGEEMNRELWSGSLAGQDWTRLGAWEQPTWGNVAVQHEQNLYSLGGWTTPESDERLSAAVWRWNLEEPEAPPVQATSLPGAPRALFAAAVFDGELYVFGGWTMSGGEVRFLRDAHRFRPATAEWEALPDLPLALEAHRAIAIEPAGILLVGGYSYLSADDPQPDKGSIRDDLWLYDPRRRSYERVGQLPAPVCDMALARLDHALLVVGGEDRGRHRTAQTLLAPLPAQWQD